MSSHRRRAGTREAFLRDVPSYSGTDKDFESSHYKSYGREEKLGPDGKHHHGSNHFPRGSDREQMHTQYTKSTRPRDDSRAAYHNGVIAAQKELGRMSAEEQKYYRTQTGGFAPHQHERLDPRAAQFRDDSLKNAQGRRAFLEAHPHGYHDAQSQNKHHHYASGAYGDHDYAANRQQHHEKYRSYANTDPRRDQWGRPVSYF